MKNVRKILIAAAMILAGASLVQLAGERAGLGSFEFVSSAQARVGRPLTPVSVAGVARRTTRRTIRRGAYIATIPRGCAYGTYYGYSLYHCGGVYYQKSGSGYVIVYF